MKILLTGCAGFIGMHVAELLLARGDIVVGVDNLNDYYDPNLKLARLARLTPYSNFRFVKGDIANYELLDLLFKSEKPQRVINLAAQAGVRYSLNNPQAYIQSNLVGFGNILEACRHHEVEHLVYASSSSVYGMNSKMPFSEHDNVDHPVSLYASTKKSNELMAHSYSHLYQLPTTGLRYFTVYGPWGRPDMSPMLFAEAISNNKPIKVFNNGNMLRDFTYIDDIAEGTIRVLDKPAMPSFDFDPLNLDPARSVAPYRIFNIGNNQPVSLLEYIETLERALGKTAIKEFMPLQPGDVIATAADTSDLDKWVGFAPNTPLQQGLWNFANWFLSYNNIM